MKVRKKLLQWGNSYAIRFTAEERKTHNLDLHDVLELDLKKISKGGKK